MSTAPATLGNRGVRGLGFGIGWISLSRPRPHVCAPQDHGPLGMGERGRLARAVGAADLIIGTGLLISPHPSRFMLARTLLNVAIGGAYAEVLSAGTPHRGRAIGGVCLMSALTANDHYLSRRLWEIEASYNPTAGPQTLAPS